VTLARCTVGPYTKVARCRDGLSTCQPGWPAGKVKIDWCPESYKPPANARRDANN